MMHYTVIDAIIYILLMGVCLVAIYPHFAVLVDAAWNLGRHGSVKDQDKEISL